MREDFRAVGENVRGPTEEEAGELDLGFSSHLRAR